MRPKIKTAMIVDDETIDQRQYRRVLDQSGMVEDILCFTYADEALAFLETENTEPIDVIFLDINLPRMNGFEFLDRLSAYPDKLKCRAVVLMLTTALTARDQERAEAFELVKDFLDKPITLEDVVNAAQLLLAERLQTSPRAPVRNDLRDSNARTAIG